MPVGAVAAVAAALLVVLLGLAWLVARNRNETKRPVSSLELITAAAPTTVPAPTESDIVPLAIALGPLDAPYVNVLRAPVRSDYRTEPFDLTDSVKNELRSWFQQVPRLALGNLLAADRYVVSFSPEVTRALSNGSMELMRSSQAGYYAIAVNADGKRIVQPGLIEKAGFPAAAIPGLLRQVAAIITAQRFLSDINRQLAKIGVAVERIKRYLEAERFGTVQASFDRLTEIIDAMKSGKWELDNARRWIGMLDDIDIDCSKIVKAGQAHKQDFLPNAAGIDIGTFRVRK